MWSQRFCFIVVFVVLTEFEIHTDATLDVIKNVTTDEEAKILSTCRHSDYQTYIRCLKRHKRHFEDGDRNGEDSLIMDEDCKMSCWKECQKHRIRDCHGHCSYCLRKVRRRQHVFIEDEFESIKKCTNSTDCDTSKSGDNNTISITTTVDVTNYLGNGTNGTNGTSRYPPDSNVVLLPFPFPFPFLIPPPVFPPPIFPPPIFPPPILPPPIFPPPILPPPIFPPISPIVSLPFPQSSFCSYTTSWPCVPYHDCQRCTCLDVTVKCHAYCCTDHHLSPYNPTRGNAGTCKSPPCIGGTY